MTPELLDALRATQEQALCYSVTVCHSRDVELCRRYRDLMVSRHSKYDGPISRNVIAKAERLLADALQIAELERMAGL